MASQPVTREAQSQPLQRFSSVETLMPNSPSGSPTLASADNLRTTPSSESVSAQDSLTQLPAAPAVLKAVSALPPQDQLPVTPPSSKASSNHSPVNTRGVTCSLTFGQLSPPPSLTECAGFGKETQSTMDNNAQAAPVRKCTPKLLRQDHLRAGTPALSSRQSSNHNSPQSITPSLDSDAAKRSPTNQNKVHFDESSDQRPAVRRLDSMSPRGTRPPPGSAPNPLSQSFASIVAGKGVDLMSKWLPSSTSALAEPLEKDSSAPPANPQRPSLMDEALLSDTLLTPPFTPHKRSEESHSTKNSFHPQLRNLEKFQSHTSLLTPPATVKHEQIKPGSHKVSSLAERSPEPVGSGHSSGRGISPRPSESPNHASFVVRSLKEQFKNLSAMDNHRPRSASSPIAMEPHSDFSKNPSLSEAPNSGADSDAFGSIDWSSEDQVAEFRKRADTFCAPPSGSFPPPTSDVSPPASSLTNAFITQAGNSTPQRHSHRSSQPAIGSAKFSAKSSSIFASNLPNAIAFSSPSSYATLASHPEEEAEYTLSQQTRRASAASPASAHHGAAANISSERHQRYHTAPVESSPLSKGSRPKVHSVGRNASFNQGSPSAQERRLDHRASLADAFQADWQRSKGINARFRPRSSTLADLGTRKFMGKTLLSTNWDDSEVEEAHEAESVRTDARSSPSGKTASSARSSVASQEQFSWKNMLSEPDSSISTEPSDLDPSPFNRPSALNTKASSTSTRYCKVLGVSPKLLGSMKGIVKVRNAFATYGALLDIYVDTLSPLGFILIGFHDMRSVQSMVQNGVKALEANFGSYLKLEPVHRHEVVQLTQDLENPILSQNEGVLSLHFDDPRGIITKDVLLEYLQRYGELKNLRPSGSNTWSVEWYDDRRAAAAQNELVSRDFADFQVTVDVPGLASNQPLIYQGGPMTSQAMNDHFLVASAMSPNVCMLPPTIRPPQPMMNHTDQYSNSLLYRYAGDPYAANFMYPWTQPIASGPPAPFYPRHGTAPLSAESLAFTTSAPHSAERYAPAIHSLDVHQQQPQVAIGRPRAFPFPGVPPSNVIDLDRIECGSDPRTTCMIKNIPNKITDEMLFNFINEICPRGFDFLYLRMDFKARLNVGYAFINFLTVENVLKFAKSKLGVKWGVFLSEKTVQMCYASIQGKENLIEKFRNSAIMEEEESFRPKVYHSNGPLVGLPEPFPHANDLQRKARSQANAALLSRPSMPSVNAIHQ